MSSNEELRQVEKYITVVEFTVDWKQARRAGLTDDEAYEIVNLTGAVFEELLEAELKRREMMKGEVKLGTAEEFSRAWNGLTRDLRENVGK